MKIIFDNDATVTDYEKFIDRYAIPYFHKKYGLEVVNPNALELEELFGLITNDSKNNRLINYSEMQVYKMINSFWIGFHYIQYTLLSRFKNGVASAINCFLKQHHEVEIHTSRSKTCEHNFIGTIARAFTICQYWLNGVFLSPSKFHFYPNDTEKLTGVLASKPLLIFEDWGANALY